MKKYLPYILLVVGAVLVTKIIDWSTSDSTDELEREKQELQEEVDGWIKKYNTSEQNRHELEKEVLVKDAIIEAYETENDSAIDIMHHGTREERDSVGAALIERLLMRQHKETSD